MNILSNKKGSEVNLHFAANASVTVTSLAANTDETVVGAAVTGASWGTDGSGFWTVKRNGNTVCVFNSSGSTNFESETVSININDTANVDVTYSGTNGFLILNLSKRSTISDSQYLVG